MVPGSNNFAGRGACLRMLLIHTYTHDCILWQKHSPPPAALYGTWATPQCSPLLDLVVASRTAVTHMVDLCTSCAEGLVVNETSQTLITKVNGDKICKCEFTHCMEVTVMMDLMILDLVGGLWSPTSQALIWTRALNSRMRGGTTSATQLPVVSRTDGSNDGSTI